MRKLLFLKLGLLGILSGFFLLSHPESHMRWRGVGTLAVGGLCIALYSGKLLPATILRGRRPRNGPSFEVLDPSSRPRRPAHR